MSDHRVFHPELAGAAATTVTVAGDEAHHAIRVKRAAVGDRVTMMDGQGHMARARIAEIIKDRKTGEWLFTAAVEDVARQPRVEPRIEVWASPAKGPRLEAMIDGLSQAGAASWSPLITERTVVEPREGKLDRMQRLAAEASKQCGRAWHLEIGTGGDLKTALSPGTVGTRVVVADASGGSYQASGGEDWAATAVRVLIGPEGGWTPAELQQAKSAGATIVSVGPHVMRIETAAVVACGIVLDAELRWRRGGHRP